MTINKLRGWIVVFFIALVIPTGLLIYQAYQELQWEAFHQQRVQAEELADRIDRQLLELIYKEENRAFSDYAFLNVTGTATSNFLQRSPLSSFPVSPDIPGLLGYFQVDANGKFTTPLLPDDPLINRYGLANDEYQQRLGLQLKLLGILDKNQLVKRKPEKPESLKPQTVARSFASSPMEADDVGAGLADAISSLSSPMRMEESMAIDSDTPIAQIEIAEAEVAASSMGEAPIAAAPMVSQQAFDQLRAAPGNAPLAKGKVSNKLGRVADLKLDKAYEDRTDRTSTEKQQASGQRQKKEGLYRKNIIPEKKARREVSRLPEARTQALAAPRDITAINKDVRIRTFESEIDTFELSLLDSGHFVLYRKVWRNGQRIIQGLLIEQQPFIEGMIKAAYGSTALSGVSHLLVAWQGDVISQFQASGYRDYLSRSSKLNGTLLYQTAFSQPLGDLELVFSINNLPAGPGATIINWIASILLLIMLIGFYLMYRSGLRQIRLLQQQQDFVSAVSHELKTPLTSIRMYGEMLQEDWASEEKKKGYYGQIVGESERLTRLINNILQLARFSRNAIQSDLRDIKVSELMDITKSAVSTPVSSAGFTLEINCDKATGQQTVNVDTDHFTQIMINLIDNALKFSANADNKTITLGCEQNDSTRIQVSIRDYGPGIPKDQIKKIFTLFYRAENELTRETVGTGIGLALVNQLMREMQGEVDVQNTNPGVQFRLVFPIVS
ncbi:MAG: HAMP domain-containing histidine kinase [Gammaproteobacteria bacterium]|nr:HAMP domain-containing histidine kinase [Gammaproteobacteria bacterium]